ncbi:sulfotransferase [Burkholderia glumae]|uniref:sulfotransferase n=1 Tax=Burkholderia glumae TaxID=337 RepID=UPI0020B41817|nr:sulfotransferase [Burkholderia glumae]
MGEAIASPLCSPVGCLSIRSLCSFFWITRSGTTLFKEALNLHSEIFIPNQTTFISPIAHVLGCISDWSVARRLVVKIITSTDDFAEVLQPYISAAEVEDAVADAKPTLAGVLNAIYTRIAQNTTSRISGDKTPTICCRSAN